MNPESQEVKKALNRANTHLLNHQHAANLSTSAEREAVRVLKITGILFLVAILAIWAVGLVSNGYSFADALDLENVR